MDVNIDRYTLYSERDTSILTPIIYPTSRANGHWHLSAFPSFHHFHACQCLGKHEKYVFVGKFPNNEEPTRRIRGEGGRGAGKGSSCRTSDIPLHSDHGAVRKMAEIGRRAAPAPYNNFSIEIVRNAKKDRIDSAAYTRAFWISFIPFVTNVPLNYAESFIV